MNHCDACGLTYDEHGPIRIPSEIHALGARYGAVLTDTATDEALLTTPPGPGIWSPVEYGCHLRDVLLAQRERFLTALVEDRPTFTPIYRDQRAELARYSDETPRQAAAGIALAADLLAWVLNGLVSDEWSRTCVYGFPERSVRTLLWLAQHTLHEGEHHLWDISGIISGGR